MKNREQRTIKTQFFYTEIRKTHELETNERPETARREEHSATHEINEQSANGAGAGHAEGARSPRKEN